MYYFTSGISFKESFNRWMWDIRLGGDIRLGEISGLGEISPPAPNCSRYTIYTDDRIVNEFVYVCGARVKS